MIKIDIEMPACCEECFALDDNGDYPHCLISHASCGYKFNIRLYRMADCPLEEIDEEKEHKNPCEWCQEWNCEGCKYAK